MTSDEVQVWSDEDKRQADEAGWIVRFGYPYIMYMDISSPSDTLRRTWVVNSRGPNVTDMEPVLKVRAAGGCELSKRGLDEATRRRAVWRLTGRAV